MSANVLLSAPDSGRRDIGELMQRRLCRVSWLSVLHQFNQPAKLLVDLSELEGGKLGRVGKAFLRALRLLLPDQWHEVGAEECVVARADCVNCHRASPLSRQPCAPSIN